MSRFASVPRSDWLHHLFVPSLEKIYRFPTESLSFTYVILRQRIGKQWAEDRKTSKPSRTSIEDYPKRSRRRVEGLFDKLSRRDAPRDNGQITFNIFFLLAL